MRLFLAVELPEALRARLGAEVARLSARLAGWRWVRPEALHVTLRFLGEVADRERVEAQTETWRRVVAAHPAIVARLSGAGVFPDPRRPRVLWAGLHEVPPEGRLAALAADLEAAARAEGFPPEDRPFRSHVTLARGARDARPVPCEAGAIGDLGTLRIEGVVLFESTLHPTGARYRAVQSFALASRAPEPGLRGRAEYPR